MSYENDLISKFLLAESIARKKAMRLNTITSEEDLLKFTIRFTSAWDAKWLTNFRKYVNHTYAEEGRYITTVDFNGCDGKLLQV